GTEAADRCCPPAKGTGQTEAAAPDAGHQSLHARWKTGSRELVFDSTRGQLRHRADGLSYRRLRGCFHRRHRDVSPRKDQTVRCALLQQHAWSIVRGCELKQSLLGFIAGGKGFAGTHDAIATFVQYPKYDQWPAFGQMIGATENGGHPWNGELMT